METLNDCCASLELSVSHAHLTAGFTTSHFTALVAKVTSETLMEGERDWGCGLKDMHANLVSEVHKGRVTIIATGFTEGVYGNSTAFAQQIVTRQILCVVMHTHTWSLVPIRTRFMTLFLCGRNLLRGGWK